MKFSLVGAGVMGEAVLGSALTGEVLDAADVLVCEKIAARREEVGSRYSVATTDDTAAALAQGDVVLLALKPQDLSSIKGSVNRNALVISIMAGVTVDAIAAITGHSRIVRVMPNTPAAIGKGMSAWTATASVTDEQRAFTARLLASLGEEVYLETEAKLDMATALSGSGPAYVFLFIEALIDAGVAAGLSRDQARILAMQTVSGSAAYAQESTMAPAELRAMVTSPAGTTAAGLRVLEQRAFRAAVIDGVLAAFERAKALGEDSRR